MYYIVIYTRKGIKKSQGLDFEKNLRKAEKKLEHCCGEETLSKNLTMSK